jgi:hypothetical protein
MKIFSLQFELLFTVNTEIPTYEWKFYTLYHVLRSDYEMWFIIQTVAYYFENYISQIFYFTWTYREWFCFRYTWRFFSATGIYSSDMRNIRCRISKAVFRNIFSLAAHPNLSETHDGTPQNFASLKGDTKLYIAINMYLHISSWPISVQACENKT